MKKVKSKQLKILAIAVYFAFIIMSFVSGYEPGKQIWNNFSSFAFEMLKLLPCAFMLIGLFDVWVKKEKIEKHLGTDSGAAGYLWVILLAGTTVGGLYVAFPVASSLFQKGAKLSVVLTYIGAAAVCRIPMTVFESSFLGLKFTIIRLVVSIPLVILSAQWLGTYLEKRHYRIKE